MSDRSEPNSDLGEDPDFLSFLREVDSYPILSEGISSGGNVPEQHATPYKPSVDELVEGARLAAESNRVLAEARARVSEERARELFERQEERQEGER